MRQRIPIVLLGVLGFGPLEAQLDGPREPVYYRMPMAIDLGEAYLSSMVLEVERLAIDQPFEQFRRRKTTVAEDVLAGFLDSLKQGDADALASAAIATTEREMSPREAGQLLAGALVQGGADDLFLRAVYPLDETTALLSWSFWGPGAGRNFVLTLDWDRGSGAVKWYPGGAPGPLDELAALVTGAENAAAGGAVAEVEFEPDAFRYSAPLGHDLARLHFNGKAYRWNVARDAAPPGDVPAFYKEAFEALLESGPRGWADYFTVESASKLREWAASFRPGELDRFVTDLRRENRHVVFILDARPFHLVFFNTFSGGPGYDTVWRDPERGTLRLTGFRMSDDIDALMRSEEHFWKPIISPIASGGPDPDAQASMPVVPSFLHGSTGTGAAVGRGSTGSAVAATQPGTDSEPQGEASPASDPPDEAADVDGRKWSLYLAFIVLGALFAAWLLQNRIRR